MCSKNKSGNEICKDNRRLRPSLGVKETDKATDELTQLFRDWTNGEFLFDFFMENIEELKEYFHIERIDEAVNDTFKDADVLQELVLEFPYTKNLDELFK